MRASFYLSQFDLKTKYRFNKNYIIFDTLLQLSLEYNFLIIDYIISIKFNLINYYIDIDNFFDDFNNYIL